MITFFSCKKRYADELQIGFYNNLEDTLYIKCYPKEIFISGDGGRYDIIYGISEVGDTLYAYDGIQSFKTAKFKIAPGEAQNLFREYDKTNYRACDLFYDKFDSITIYAPAYQKTISFSNTYTHNYKFNPFVDCEENWSKDGRAGKKHISFYLDFILSKENF
jgi:hypothetical protein